MGQLLERLYEKLWSKTGGKPWKEIVREDRQPSPLLYLLIFLGPGILLARLGREKLAADNGWHFRWKTVRAFRVVRP